MTQASAPRETTAGDALREVVYFVLEFVMLVSAGLLGAVAAWLIMGSPDAF